MKTFTEQLSFLSEGAISILDHNIALERYVPIDLSVDNKDLKTRNITDPEICASYIDQQLVTHKGSVAYGGYLEKRNLYSDKEGFSGNALHPRNIHLGVDFWCTAGTKVQTPISGKVHSFMDNASVGDYGPTIILEHQLVDEVFYTLYGHLSRTSLEGLFVGKKFIAGSVLGDLGTPEVNVNYAPHLHFQIIRDMKGYSGDYPGVCSQKNLAFYRKNCPDPNLLLKL